MYFPFYNRKFKVNFSKHIIFLTKIKSIPEFQLIEETNHSSDNLIILTLKRLFLEAMKKEIDISSEGNDVTKLKRQNG